MFFAFFWQNNTFFFAFYLIKQYYLLQSMWVSSKTWCIPNNFEPNYFADFTFFFIFVLFSTKWYLFFRPFHYLQFINLIGQLLYFLYWSIFDTAFFAFLLFFHYMSTYRKFWYLFLRLFLIFFQQLFRVIFWQKHFISILCKNDTFFFAVYEITQQYKLTDSFLALCCGSGLL